MKKVILLIALTGLVSLFAAEAVKPTTPITPTEGPGQKTQVEKNVVKVEKVETKASKQVQKEVHRVGEKF
ncbi:MAG TPA: hypothetical protein VFX66_04495 [Sulfuricurvum sp.]|nr:hypothetical protein [Sulfuricurvum sp.]